MERLKNENSHLKSLNKENEQKVSELESTIKTQQDNITKLENRLKSENQRENIDKLLSISIGILSEFATKEDVNSIHLKNDKSNGPKKVLLCFDDFNK